MPEIKFDFLPTDWTESYRKMDLERKWKVLEILKHFALWKTIWFKNTFDAEIVNVAIAIIKWIQSGWVMH